MPLKVETADGEEYPIHSPEDFEKIFQVRYLPSLAFESVAIQKKIEKKCNKGLRKGWITEQQKWLGHYFSDGIQGKLTLDLTIRWIDEKLGYGLFTNRALPAHFYIGEYTGLIRKRRWRGRWKNLYCFDYSIGGKSTSCVIDAQAAGNYVRFINHSARPNLTSTSAYCDRFIHVILHTNQAIPAGTQLCYDYGEDYWKKRSPPKDLQQL